MNKVLVIKGSGFMCSQIVDLLSDNEYVVTFLDKVNFLESYYNHRQSVYEKG